MRSRSDRERWLRRRSACRQCLVACVRNAMIASLLLGDGLEGIGRGGDDRVSGGAGEDAVDGDQTNGDIATGGNDRLDGGPPNGGDTDHCENGKTLVNCEP